MFIHFFPIHNSEYEFILRFITKKPLASKITRTVTFEKILDGLQLNEKYFLIPTKQRSTKKIIANITFSIHLLF